MSAHSSITHNSPQSGNNPKGPSTDVYTNIHTMEYYSTVKRNEVLPHATSEQPWKIFCVYLVTQSCPTLCKPMDCNPSGSSLHGIFQARILEQAAISYSIELVSLASPVLAGGFFTTSAIRLNERRWCHWQKGT